MEKRRVSLTCLVAASLVLGGCNILPEPGSLIQVPKQVAATSADSESVYELAKKYLPKGTVLLTANAPIGTDAVLCADLDGDGQDEAVVFYQSKNNADQVGLFILKKQNGKWEKVFAKKGSGYDVSWASASDLTGDGVKELLVGWKIGSSAGNVLDVYTWKQSGVEQLTKVNYHDLDMIEIENDPKTRLAVWKKDVNDIYNIDLLQWNNGLLISDKKNYPAYFPEAVKYYQRRTEAVPDAAYYWYYLADAYLKANYPEQALLAVNKGMAHKMVVPSYNQFTDLKEKIEKTLEQNDNSDFQYEIRDAGITIDVPREIAPYISFEENNGTMNSYVVSVFVSPYENQKELLFSIEIYSKDMYIPEKDADLEEIAETEEFLYVARRGNRDLTFEESNIYEQSVTLIEKMIANVRPGLVYPEYTSLKYLSVIEQVKVAVNKYWDVVRGGTMPSKIAESFTHNETDYRYMGSDLNSSEKLNEFLSESYTSGAIRSYIERSGIIEHDGILAQPNADGGSLLNYEKATVVREKDNGTEKEYDLKVPLGTSLSFEYVHVVFSKTKDGWKISSDIGTF
ncbi:DL-endopeptidase inhibitor IseA family protein [Lederbergia citrea]|uniref:DL-endopeptidase inhibitor IseA family protein n=1 Tax=Lederbergia citrea TaxID=2833581 RepID=UPI001BC92B38|nr:DL-endopeptidase inhibitor IseA family protein [Lederbergia citrea]MBS4205652.1 hypothetical protein [Lederbergia citrea]